jgi:hypothetical protein
MSRSISKDRVGIAIGPTAVTIVAVLSLGFGSGFVSVTDAVFVSVVGEPGAVTTMVTDAELDGGRAPRATTTMPFVPMGGPAQVP